ncbi:MAG: STAS domain-containing protein [Magnetospirillum sp. WYHS-4]
MKIDIQIDGPTATIHLTGEITAQDRAAFEEVAAKALASGPQQVVVDLSRLDFMDSAGLGFLLILLKMGEEKGAAVALAQPRGDVKDQLELARFNLLFDIRDSA